MTKLGGSRNLRTLRGKLPSRSPLSRSALQFSWSWTKGHSGNRCSWRCRDHHATPWTTGRPCTTPATQDFRRLLTQYPEVGTNCSHFKFSCRAPKIPNPWAPSAEKPKSPGAKRRNPRTRGADRRKTRTHSRRAPKIPKI